MEKYDFDDHPEHEDRLLKWQEKAINITLDTSTLTSHQEETLKSAIKNLYKHAGLEDVKNIVIADSPFTAMIAAGFASAIWHLFDNKIEPNITTWDTITNTPSAETLSVTREATTVVTQCATQKAISDVVTCETWHTVFDAVWRVPVDVTGEATTWDIFMDATWKTTSDLTQCASWYITFNAISNAISEAVCGTTNNISSDIITKTTSDVTQHNYDSKIITDLNNHLGLGSFGLECAKNAPHMCVGGNFWYPNVSFITFFRDVVKLDLDYTKFNDFATAAELGSVRFMHKDFCIVSRKPLFIKMDEQNRPHCDDGMYIKWRDGTGCYAYHGTRVPGWILTNPELITLDTINKEQNKKVKRVMRLKYGIGK